MLNGLRRSNTENALVNRSRTTHRTDTERNDQRPEIELAAMAKRMPLVGWLFAEAYAEQHKQTVACIDH